MRTINEIVADLREKEEVTDIDFFRSIQEINENYFVLAPTKKSVEFTKMLDESLNLGLNYKNRKLPIGMTFEELLLKAMAFNHRDPFSYINKYCITIFKSEEVINFLDSVKLMSKLTGEADPKLTDAEMKLFSNKFHERIHKQFVKNFEKLLPNGFLYRHSDNLVKFKQGHCLIELSTFVDGTEEEHKRGHIRDGSETYEKLEPLINILSKALYGKEYKIRVCDKAILSTKLLNEFDGETIFRTESLISENRKIGPGKFRCYTGTFLNYNQFCDMVEKGSLK